MVPLPPTSFDTLVQKSVSDGVTDERNLPFWLSAEGGQPTGILMVHGFAASPWEMRLFGDKMAEAGFQVLGIRLPGHGTVPEDLEQRTMEEWISAVQEGVEVLSQRCSRVIVAGQSTGALVSLAASTTCRMDGLLLLSPFLRTRHRLSPLAGILYPIHRWRRRTIREMEEHCYYHRQPIKAVHQIHRLIRLVKRTLPLYERPLMIIAADGDATIDPYSAIALFKRYGNQQKSLHLLGPTAPHVLTTTGNPYLAEVLKLSRTFFHLQG